MTTARIGEDGGVRFAVVRALVIAVPLAVLSGGLAALVGLRQPAIYESKAMILVDQPRQLATAGNEGILLKLNALRFKYAALTKTTPIVAPVATALKAPPGAVRSAVSGLVTADSLLLAIVGRSQNASFAHSVAEETADEIVRYAAREQKAVQIPPIDRVEFTVVQPASPPIKTEPDSQTVLALAAGVLIAVLVVSTAILVSLLNRRSPSD